MRWLVKSRRNSRDVFSNRLRATLSDLKIDKKIQKRIIQICMNVRRRASKTDWALFVESGHHDKLASILNAWTLGVVADNRKVLNDLGADLKKGLEYYQRSYQKSTERIVFLSELGYKIYNSTPKELSALLKEDARKVWRAVRHNVAIPSKIITADRPDE